MASVEEICSMALARVGEPPITDIDGTDPNSTRCRQFYAIARDSLLRKYPWNFATTRARLQRDAKAPAWGFPYQYALPADYIRLQNVNDFPLMDPLTGEDLGPPPIPYEIESGFILTFLDTVFIKYTRRVTESGRFDAMFVDALAARLAFDLSIPLRKPAGFTEMMSKIAAAMFSEARGADASESGRAQRRERSSWLSARS